MGDHGCEFGIVGADACCFLKHFGNMLFLFLLLILFYVYSLLQIFHLCAFISELLCESIKPSFMLFLQLCDFLIELGLIF